MTDSKKISSALVVGVAAAVAVAGVVAGSVWSKRELQTVAAPVGEVAGNAKVSHKRYMVPVTMSQPSKGPADALVTIVEWCDVRGQACAAADPALAALLRKHDKELRLVYRQLPDARPDADLVNNFARGALIQAGKFWEVRERLLQAPADKPLTQNDLGKIAQDSGVDWSALSQALQKQQFASQLAIDVQFAKMFGVTTTPAFFVNGRPVPAVAPDQLEKTLQPIIDEELAEAAWHVQRGVAASDVYNTIIQDAAWSVTDDPKKRIGQAQPKTAMEAYKAAQALRATQGQ